MNCVLPTGYTLRQAHSGDMGAIRRLVLTAMLDPTQLRWSQFWVIEQAGKVIACGQLRNFLDAQELGSVVVKPEFRGRGLGSHLIQHLIQQATQPLYLECLGKRLPGFYTRFGFVPVAWEDLPPGIKQKFRLSNLAAKVFRLPVTIMQHRVGHC
ncbi:GNAT family N-acetyltransferase [Leptothermofonsia sichuanensis E412]|nr:GNAT family N-acetyltransferase [Leptothermofonsia sichuanensis]QZZ21686.1 GNAT family N-acetyltransferase [Leptothermofonsia sichuanensis E412]